MMTGEHPDIRRIGTLVIEVHRAAGMRGLVARIDRQFKLVHALEASFCLIRTSVFLG